MHAPMKIYWALSTNLVTKGKIVKKKMGQYVPVIELDRLESTSDQKTNITVIHN